MDLQNNQGTSGEGNPPSGKTEPPATSPEQPASHVSDPKNKPLLRALGFAGLAFGVGIWVGRSDWPSFPLFPQDAPQVIVDNSSSDSSQKASVQTSSPDTPPEKSEVVSNPPSPAQSPTPGAQETRLSAENLVLPATAQSPEWDAKPSALSLPFSHDFNGLVPSTYPVQNRSLKDFSHLDEKSFLAAHKIEVDKDYRSSVLMLKQHLVGTLREKQAVVRKCESIFKSESKNFEAPSGSNLGCSYWRILDQNKSKTTEKRVGSKKKKSTGNVRAVAKYKRVLPKTEKEWNQFDGIAYYDALEILQIRSLKEAVRMSELASQADSTCKTSHAKAALVRNMEEYLPDATAFAAMEKVTQSLFSCLKPAEDEFEIIHVRMGLLYLERARFNEAATHLELALIAESPSEEYRSLFWRGFVESLRSLNKGNIEPERNKYWDKLAAKFPLTLHTLVADELLGIHSFQRIRNRPVPAVSMYAGEAWDSYNLAMFISGLLISRQEKGPLERWSRYLTDKVKPADFETGLFLAMTHLNSGNTRSGILNVFGILRDFGNDKLTPEVLELLYPLRFQNLVVKHSQDVDAALVMSLIRQESSFNPKAQSPVGARGLMQVMPATARRVNKGKDPNLMDPQQNIIIGTRYLRKLLAAHDDNYVFTLASYNAGPRPVNRWRERYDERIPLLFSDLIAYPETRNYVSGLLRNMHWYRTLLENVAHAREDRAGAPWTAKTIAPLPGQFGLASTSDGISLVVDNSKIEQAENAAKP